MLNIYHVEMLVLSQDKLVWLGTSYAHPNTFNSKNYITYKLKWHGHQTIIVLHDTILA